MSRKCFLFSGQGSQKPGMGRELYEFHNEAKNVLECASDVFGLDMRKVCFDFDSKTMSRTIYAQSAVMTMSLMIFECLKSQNCTPEAVAGHSLGEYSAMVASGIVSMEDGFRMVKIRSNLMQECVKNEHGAMCAVIGMSADEIEDICDRVDGYVVCSNFNSPVQIVVSGEYSAVEKMMAMLKGISKRCIMLKVEGAFHSELMRSIVEPYRKELQKIKFKKPMFNFYSNVTGDKISDLEKFPELLSSHLVCPVRFVDEIKAIHRDGFDIFWELGPSSVLSGLVRKIISNVHILSISDETTLVQAIQTTG